MEFTLSEVEDEACPVPEKIKTVTKKTQVATKLMVLEKNFVMINSLLNH